MPASPLGRAERLVTKYSQDSEFFFWRDLVDVGLMAHEEQAVVTWLKRDDRVLDVGCGCGREAVALAGRGLHVHATDLVKRMVDATQELSDKLGLSVEVCQGDICEAVPYSCQFDAAVLFGRVYQHIPEREQRIRALVNIRTSLKPGGVVLLSVFNEGDVGLLARLRWFRESRWEFAEAIACSGTNLLDTRYSRGRVDCSLLQAATTSDRLRLARWLVGYCRWLVQRKVVCKYPPAKPGAL